MDTVCRTQPRLLIHFFPNISRRDILHVHDRRQVFRFIVLYLHVGTPGVEHIARGGVGDVAHN